MKWTADLVSLLGTKPDKQLAKELGINWNTLASARINRGIPAYQPQRKWTADEIALLGRISDAEVGRRTGRNRESVQFKRYSLKIPGIVVVHPPK